MTILVTLAGSSLLRGFKRVESTTVTQRKGE